MKMKISPVWLVSVLGLGLWLSGCSTGSSSATLAPSDQLDVGVRSYVPDKTFLWAKRPNKIPGDGGHGKVYAIFAVNEVKAVDHLLRPVNEAAVLSLLMNELDTHGFREFKKGQKPEILLTISYGRGEMTNPYVRDTGEVGGGRGGPSPQIMPDEKYGEDPSSDRPSTTMAGYTTDNPPPGVTITGAMALQLMDERGYGFEAKLQKATFEKLFIRITAWQFPKRGEDPEPLMLWKTIMVVDDPDHRDLNTVAGAMIAAGAPYFDKEIREPEVDVMKPLPATHVNVGPTKVGQPFQSEPPK